MDNPDLIVPCVVGDGEAETGATATYVLLSSSGNSTKFIDLFKELARIQVH